jgi:hypothetical protein
MRFVDVSRGPREPYVGIAARNATCNRVLTHSFAYVAAIRCSAFGRRVSRALFASALCHFRSGAFVLYFA